VIPACWHDGVMGKPENLTPFDSERAREAAIKSSAARRRRKEEAERQVQTRAELMKLKLDELPSREEVGMLASAAALDILQKFLLGEVSFRNAGEATKFLEVVHNIARLEDNRPTTITEHLSAEDRKELLAGLRETIDQRGGLRAVVDGA
jgi:hypothetical protein